MHRKTQALQFPAGRTRLCFHRGKIFKSILQKLRGAKNDDLAGVISKDESGLHRHRFIVLECLCRLSKFGFNYEDFTFRNNFRARQNAIPTKPECTFDRVVN